MVGSICKNKRKALKLLYFSSKVCSMWHFGHHFKAFFGDLCDLKGCDGHKHWCNLLLFTILLYKKQEAEAACPLDTQWAKTRKKVHFDKTMHCLPQSLKSTFFEIFSSGAAPKESAEWEVIPKNVDFSLWGNRATSMFGWLHDYLKD